jgi:hypothetical protein
MAKGVKKEGQQEPKNEGPQEPKRKARRGQKRRPAGAKTEDQRRQKRSPKEATK